MCVCLCHQTGKYRGDGYEQSDEENDLFMMWLKEFQQSAGAFTAFSTLVLSCLSSFIHDSTLPFSLFINLAIFVFFMCMGAR